MVGNKTGLKSTSIEAVWSVYDTLFCEVRLITNVRALNIAAKDNSTKSCYIYKHQTNYCISNVSTYK